MLIYLIIIFIMFIGLLIPNQSHAQTQHAGYVFMANSDTTFGWFQPFWTKYVDTSIFVMTFSRAQHSIDSIGTLVSLKLPASSFTKAAMVALGMMAYTDTLALSARINAKYTTPTGTTLQYIRGDGTLQTLPVAKRSETYSGTTNGSGVYTVTFPVAFTAAPNIQASLNPQSATNQYIRISSVSTTGFTVNAYSFNSNNLLGIVSLITTTSNIVGAGIDVLVTEK